MIGGDDYLKDCMNTGSLVERIVVSWQKQTDEFIFGDIKKHFVDDKEITEYLLNETAIKIALEKQVSKKPIHVHREHDKHEWEKNADGTIDEYAFEYGFCSGVRCRRCGEKVCTHCNPNYDEYAGKCIVNKDFCPTCEKEITKVDKYCNGCGQKIDWSVEE